MKIGVTGASGLVGTALVQQLSGEQFTGYAISRREIAGLTPGWDTVARRAMLERNVTVDCLIHLEVKQHVVSPVARDIAEFEAVNVLGTQQWLDWCTRNAVERFVYFSSIKAVHATGESFTLESATCPHESHYGASKWAAERKVEAWVAADPRRSALILRPAVVYGPGNTGNIGAMISAIARRRFFLVGRNDNVKSIVSIRNVTAAVAFLLPTMRAGRCEIFNITDRESYSVREIDAMIRACFGKSGNSPTLPLPIAHLAAYAGDLLHRVTGRTILINSSRLRALREHTCFSCEKLVEAGFVHPETTAQGLRCMVAWYQQRE